MGGHTHTIDADSYRHRGINCQARLVQKRILYSEMNEIVNPFLSFLRHVWMACLLGRPRPNTYS